ncbi:MULTISPECIES: UDP-N-acetylmuramate--L-alanine ligase [Protofrankia]|uniref:UDP-N-acetylmuramate--L-alanine ligase n=1 Tax=Candidatus Protofrankia datiscae TaxID=2716812 RepID=F8AXQ4_9ACTN|nr:MULTISPECIES: UDP-N-acetylmuramate--L-alanine ligase [Protofrankia]AEH10410.1 UDP-N-acetylmuramate--L-alanine ligase [Candidatus Protofrankia datiscae]
MTGESLQHVHFLGIAGSGLSALAHVHLARGGTVSGSDAQDAPRLDALRAAGARIRVGAVTDPAALDAELDGVDVVVASSAFPDGHPELLAARRRGLPVRRRSQWLPELTAGYDLVAVAGSHGKSTTSAMLTLVLRAAGVDPTAVIGAEVAQLGGNALVGAGRVFVLEADEYGGAFAGLDPALAVITNVEWEHPDLFPDEASVRRAFTAFAARVRPGGTLVVCGDDPGVRAVLAALPASAPVSESGSDAGPGDTTGGGRARVIDYGLQPGRSWQAVNLRTTPGGGQRATVRHDGDDVGTLTLALPGAHTVRNALAVLAAATELGVEVASALAILATFTGADRRFTLVGTAPATDRQGPLEVIDDYAHHPTEIRATLAAARQRAGTREVWVAVQPHTFSRLAALLDDFADAFTDADRVYVTDIYAAREHDTLGLHACDLVKKISIPQAAYYVPWDKLTDRLATDLSTSRLSTPDGVLLLTLGAGTITETGPCLLAALRSAAL